MSANALLLWMSARGRGSWQQFRAAVEELHVDEADEASDQDDDAADQFAFPLYQTLRLNLQRAGHAEFFFGDEHVDWRVAPPTIAGTRDAGKCRGFLAGARSPKLLDRVRSAASGSMHIETHASGADQISIVVNDERALASIAEAAGLQLQLNAPEAVLSCLAAVDNLSVCVPAPVPIGNEWVIERFSAADLRWHKATREEAERTSCGLFRFSFRHQRETLFCAHGRACHMPAAVGKFVVLRRGRRKVLAYDRDAQVLRVPATCRPPFLIERGLVFCSGVLPTFVAGRPSVLEYPRVPPAIFRTAASLLRQDF